MGTIYIMFVGESVAVLSLFTEDQCYEHMKVAMVVYNMLTLVMLRPCIDGLICKIANYIFINFKTLYLSAQ